MVPTETLTQEQWAAVALELFCALDDVDTASDIAKGNAALYANLVGQAHRKRFRWQHLFDTEGDVSAFNQPPTEDKA